MSSNNDITDDSDDSTFPTFDELDGLLEPVGVGVAVVEDVRAERDPRWQDCVPGVVYVVDRVQHRLHRLK